MPGDVNATEEASACGKEAYRLKQLTSIDALLGVPRLAEVDAQNGNPSSFTNIGWS